MIKAADANGDQEIQFDEFVVAIEKASKEGATTGDGRSFASVMRRKQQSKPMTWHQERFGNGVIIEPKEKAASRSGKGCGVAILAPWMPGDDTNKYKVGSVHLEVTELSGDLWVGVVGRNFQPDGEWWNSEFFPAAPEPTAAEKEAYKKKEKKELITAVCAQTGSCFVKGSENKSARVVPFGAPGQPSHIQLDIDVDKYELGVQVLMADAEGNDQSVAKVAIENKMSELAVAVCFGETPPGQKTSLKIVGSSCEHFGRGGRRDSKDQDEMGRDGGDGGAALAQCMDPDAAT